MYYLYLPTNLERWPNFQQARWKENKRPATTDIKGIDLASHFFAKRLDDFEPMKQDAVECLGDEFFAVAWHDEESGNGFRVFKRVRGWTAKDLDFGDIDN